MPFHDDLRSELTWVDDVGLVMRQQPRQGGMRGEKDLLGRDSSGSIFMGLCRRGIGQWQCWLLLSSIWGDLLSHRSIHQYKSVSFGGRRTLNSAVPFIW